MRDATFSRRDMLRAGGALTIGAAFAERSKAAAPEPSGDGPVPTSWVDSAMPEVTHRMIETNGIRLHVAEQGRGPLIILCHGFPECWYSWRHQLRALAEAGFRAVAPDLRGYGRSDRPEEVETNPVPLPAWVTESDVEVYVAEFTRTGFRGGINFYRNVDRSWELLAPFAGAAVTIPALYIAGNRDVIVAVNSQFIAKQSIMVPKLRPAVMLAGCGHWTQQERAPEVNAAMIDFLRSL